MTTVNPDDAPASLRDEQVRARRKAMLSLPHIAPLTAFAEKLRLRGSVEVPNFDPLDGGTKSRVLFLFEKPGPMAAEGKGSGFISRNNDDPTAEAIFEFMHKAAIPRELTVIWNLIPWWNGTVKVTATEQKQGAACLADLLRLLPKLRAVVMVGRKAGTARPYLETTGMKLFESDHPSRRVKARWADRWNAIPREWAKAGAYVAAGRGPTPQEADASAPAA